MKGARRQHRRHLGCSAFLLSGWLFCQAQSTGRIDPSVKVVGRRLLCVGRARRCCRAASPELAAFSPSTRRPRRGGVVGRDDRSDAGIVSSPVPVRVQR